MYFKPCPLVLIKTYLLCNFSGPASKLILKLSLAVWAALIGTLFTFPGLRIARMHWDSLRLISSFYFLSC